MNRGNFKARLLSYILKEWRALLEGVGYQSFLLFIINFIRMALNQQQLTHACI